MEVVAQQSSYATLLSARWALFLGTLPHSWRDLLPDVNLALFLVGFLAVRYGVLDEPRNHVRLIAGRMIYGALAWAISWLVLRNLRIPVPGIDWPVVDGLGLVQDQWFCFTYVGAVVLLLGIGQCGRPGWGCSVRLDEWP